MKNMKNSVRLIGNLGFDPEVKEFESGKKRAKMSIATNEGFRDGDGNFRQETQWHTVIAWGSSAEYAERNLRKGSPCVIDGKLKTRAYEGADGNKRYITEIVASELFTLKDREERGSSEDRPSKKAAK